MAVEKKSEDLSITLYSTGCPKCKVLEDKLNKIHIPYHTITDKAKMLEKGFTKVPMLQVNKTYLNFYDAAKWINTEGATFYANRT